MKQKATRMAARAFALATGIVIAASWAGARADQVQLNNGDRLTGKVSGIDGDKLVFETGSLGKVKILAKDIFSLATDGVVTIEFKEGGFATGRLSSLGEGAIRLSGPADTTSEFRLAGVKAIHPGSKIPVPEFKWKGRINVGATKAEGNTDSEAYHVDAEAQGRGRKDRITVAADYNREASEGDDTADNARISAQYDRFISKQWFVFLQGSAERDDFEDLNLRTTIGAGAGYQIIDTEQTHLSVEASPTYVNEDFRTTEDRDFMSGRWAVKFDAYVFDKFAQLFHNHEGLVNLEETRDVLIRSKQGVRIPIRNSLNVTMQVNWDFDNEPAPGRKRSDTKYILSVGFVW